MTSDMKISELFEISSRFLRSVHLERDFNDSGVLKEYILSSYSQDCLKRIAKGLEDNSGHRAWRITGDYGTGKSSFALFLAHWFAGHADKFPDSIKKSTDYKLLTGKAPGFVPVLVTGSRAPLGLCILKALRDRLNSLHARGKKSVSELVSELENCIEPGGHVSDDLIIKLVVKANHHIISSNKGTGLLIIIDELGKFLEFAALYPEQQDIYLLQRLAESASRSEQKPFFILGLLHQGFGVYADQLSQSAQKEWEKVAARFEEVVFNQPIEQTSTLIASALKVRMSSLPKGCSAEAKKEMDAAINHGWFGAAPVRKVLSENAARLYPVHPTVLPVLIRIFSRFGQNERSLFSFLLSNEPFGLQYFAERSLRKGLYFRLYDLYDYVRSNFGYRLSVQSYKSHWNQIDSMIESFAANSELEVRILKTVGILNLINQNDLLATEQSIVLSVADISTKEIKNAIGNLQKNRRILYNRGAGGGFCLWPHTSVDLDQAYEKASKAVGTLKNVSGIVKNYVDPTPIVARRHYIKTGNLRHFNVHYCSVYDLSSLVQKLDNTADGSIIIPLCETKEEQSVALEFVSNPKLKKRQEILAAIPPPLSILAGLVQEAQRWEWVARNTSELEADRFAAEEVSRQKNNSRTSLLKRINSFIGLRQFTGVLDLELYHKGEKLPVSSGRELLSFLSDICDKLYSKAPDIKNELVNRRSLSGAAAAARMRLIERMLSESGKPFLGMDSTKKPPEMSVYLSVLKQSMLHQQESDLWKIGLPGKRQDVCNILPVMKQIEKIVKSKPDTRISITKIFRDMKKPPYGVRDGLIPILLTAFKVLHEHEVAFYEDGSFLRRVAGEEFLRMIKAPESFEIQYCKIEGVRAELFYKLLAALELKNINNNEPELLDIVQPLCVFVAELPKYVHNTKQLSDKALAVRDAILSASEPVKLLFDDLPVACGFEPFKSDGNFNSKTAHDFVQRLKIAHNDLKIAYPELNNRLKKQVLEAFNFSGNFVKLRNSVAERAERIAVAVTEPDLKAFCLRLLDENLPDSEWIESIGSYIASKPPDKWNDNDENIFNQELIQKTMRFSRVESVVFPNTGKLEDSVGMRLSLTQSDGNELEKVIYIRPDEEDEIKNLQKKINTMIEKDKVLGLAAAYRAIWDTLSKEAKG